ncbi:hypothetical protein BC830DRAFT_1091187 [Chytriomyces sp. MP71]|nr:hypothetical protein BC830DRAFT_1091187 [Chytriomyces sp. MP71]
MGTLTELNVKATNETSLASEPQGQPPPLSREPRGQWVFIPEEEEADPALERQFDGMAFSGYHRGGRGGHRYHGHGERGGRGGRCHGHGRRHGGHGFFSYDNGATSSSSESDPEMEAMKGELRACFEKARELKYRMHERGPGNTSANEVVSDKEGWSAACGRGSHGFRGHGGYHGHGGHHWHRGKGFGRHRFCGEMSESPSQLGNEAPCSSAKSPGSSANEKNMKE